MKNQQKTTLLPKTPTRMGNNGNFPALSQENKFNISPQSFCSALK
jgi:hypothetical protein